MIHRTVLVVADRDSGAADASGAAALADLLGAQVTVATNADDVLRRVVTQAFDLVTLPADPVGMCFHELTSAIEAACRSAKVPIPPVWRLEATEMTGGSSAVPAEQPTGPAATDEPPSIDLSTLAALEADIGDRSFVLDTVEVYLTELPERVAAIAAGLAAGDAAEVKSVAHSLKSSSAMLGALRLADLCSVLEQHAGTGQGFGDVPSLTGRLTAEAAATESGLHAYLAS